VLQDQSNISAGKLKLITPQPNQNYKIGQGIPLQSSYSDSTNRPDSIQFMVNGRRIGSVRKINDIFIWKSADAKAGISNVSAVAFKAAVSVEQENVSIKLYPGTPPAMYTYKVINTYPHKTDAYTQGLIFDNDEFIEGDGLYQESTLREVKIQTGEVLKEYNLPSDIFGEGITSFDDKIIQISWKEQVAFIYDRKTFRLITKMNYPIKEGWGITYNGTKLIMSDGSSIIYFLDKDYLTEVARIEVYDNHGPVEKLNELEYIEGEIWANVYTTDTIVRINPKTGVITGKIDMTGLLRPEDRTANTDVLNGIAYDPKTKRIWVTGKRWPKLFQIALQQKEH